MRATFLLLLMFVSSLLATNVQSQVSKVNISTKNSSVIQVLRTIESQTDYLFVYDKNEIDLTREISLSVENCSVAELLSRIFSNTNVAYAMEGTNIMLMQKPNALQQQKVLTGKVADSTGGGLPGVSVAVKGTTNGTITDANGNYSLSNISAGGILVFSFVGMTTQEVPFTNQATLNVTLKEETIGIEEVVAVGYGTQKKKDVSGAIESVNISELQKFKTTGVVNSLQGLAAGVSVENTSGAPGATPNITIRGVGTFGNYAPLVIVDGVESSLDRVDANDIESFSVLKDGSAAAIYGSRAANGVILVVTKKGKTGTPTISLDVDHSVNIPYRFWPMLNANDYVKVAKLAYADAGEVVPDYINNASSLGSTDWIKEMTSNGSVSKYRFNINGGVENISYDVSATLNKEKGIMINSDLTSPVLRARIDVKKGRLSMGTTVNLRYRKGQSFSSSGESELMDLIRTVPLGTPKDANGNWVGYLGTGATKVERGNPLFKALNPDKEWKNNIVDINAFAEYEIIKGLKYKIQGKYSNEDYWSYWFNPKYYLNSHNQAPLDDLSESRSNYNDWQLTNLLTFDKKIGEHSFNLLTGYEAKEANYRNLAIYGDNFPFSDLRVPANIVGAKSIQGGAYSESYISQFARLNYTYADKYYVNLTLRRDGSSKFSPNNRYGSFPSGSIAWRISKENFLKESPVISDLKLRVSYGKLGNDQIGNYKYYNLMYSAVDYEGTAYVYNSGHVAGYTVMNLANLDTRWETKESKNIGMDLGLWNNKLEIRADYFDNRTIDLITDRYIPGSIGVITTIKSNFGTIKNYGWEFSSTYKNYDRDFKYTATFNISSIRNKVIVLNNSEVPIYDAGYVDYSVPMTRTVENKPMGQFYLYTAQGIFKNQAEVAEWNKQGKEIDGEFVPLQPNAQPGDLRFVDMNKDGILDENDKSFVGSPWPDFEYSLILSGAYKGFDLTMNWGGVYGNDILNGLKYNTENAKRYKIMNMSETMNDAWTPQNSESKVPRLSISDPNNNNRPSTLYLENGSYLRLRMLQIGYTVPKQLLTKLKLGLSGIRVYSSGSNLLTFTKYSGPSPEVSNGGNFEKGVDRGYYPLYKSFIFGIQVKL